MRLLTVMVPVVAACLTACGQTGALYLPDEEVKTPVEIRGPETPPSATQPAPAAQPEQPAEPEDEEDKKSVPPAGG